VCLSGSGAARLKQAASAAKHYKQHGLGDCMSEVREVVEQIRSIAEEISRNKVRDIRLKNDEDYGFIVEVVLNQNDKSAFETWLRLIEEVRPKGFVLSVDWTGENILSESAFVQYAVEVMLRSGVSPIRKDKFSAVKEVREVRI